MRAAAARPGASVEVGLVSPGGCVRRPLSPFHSAGAAHRGVMSAQAKPLVYLVLGASGSGRREILADLAADGLGPEERAAVLLPEAEAPVEEDGRLPPVTRWSWEEGVIVAALPRDCERVFFVVDGRRNPVDQIEAFKAWLESRGAEVARVLCVVNCQLVTQHPELLAWYEACVHFADVVLLSRREGVENRLLSEFRTHFRKLFYPCLFEMVKDGRVKNPALVLEPQARRMSQAFDEEQDWIFHNAEGEEIDEEDVTDDEEEEIEATQVVDPYFERRQGGRRVKEIPDIARFLDASDAAGTSA